MSEQPKWNFEEFKSYLLLYASNADMDISPEEVAIIKQKITDKQYQQIKDEFDQANDFQRLQTIIDYKGLYFPTEDRARELMASVVQIFNADGNYSHLEANCMRLLKRLI